MSTGHTDLPWSARVDEAVTVRDSQDNQLAILTHMKTILGGRRDVNEVVANAEFIVRACNAHDDLVKALKQTQALLFVRTDKNDAGAMEAIADALAALEKAGAR